MKLRFVLILLLIPLMFLTIGAYAQTTPSPKPVDMDALKATVKKDVEAAKKKAEEATGADIPKAVEELQKYGEKIVNEVAKDASDDQKGDLIVQWLDSWCPTNDQHFSKKEWCPEWCKWRKTGKYAAPEQPKNWKPDPQNPPGGHKQYNDMDGYAAGFCDCSTNDKVKVENLKHRTHRLNRTRKS